MNSLTVLMDEDSRQRMGSLSEFGQTFGENDVIGCFAVSGPESCGFVARSGWRALEIPLLPISCFSAVDALLT